jgi:hypothetical protein
MAARAFLRALERSKIFWPSGTGEPSDPTHGSFVANLEACPNGMFQF